MGRRKTSKSIKYFFVIILGIIVYLLSQNPQFMQLIENRKDLTVNVISIEELNNIKIETGKKSIYAIDNDNSLRVYYFDVGQADSIFVVNNGKTMLIDSGNNDDGQVLVENLKTIGIKKIDYLVGTHPHEDHIGGMDDIINNFEIGTIFMPEVKTNTKTFEDVLDSMIAKNIAVTTPGVGDKFNVGNAKCEIMGIENDVKDLNEASVIIRMEFGELSYLFMGDATTNNEKVRTWPQSTILKVGHHGSNTSTSEDFLNQVLPTISIISVGEANSFGHPHKETFERLLNLGTNIYRTDELGNIVIIQN